MVNTRSVADLRLKSADRNAFIKHFKGEIGARALQRKLGITNTRYYGICNAILKDAIAKGQVVPEELLNI